MSKPSQRLNSRGSAAGLVILVIALCLAAVALIYRQTIVDHVIAWQFQPGPGVMQLADQSSMNNNGRFIYRSSQPQIDGRESFNSVCTNKDAQAAVLGCYVNNRIYIFGVTDSRLKGIKTVTAAHEMLHAAYARLSTSQRTKVNSMVEAAYQKVKNQDNLKARMAIYAKTEPGERDNELHSVLGTEVAGLPSDLETYYGQYFSDRGQVVAVYTTYQSVFTRLQNQADTIRAQMTQLQGTIESSSASYTSAISSVNSDIQSFNTRANNGGFSSQSEFVSERNDLAARVNALEGQRTSINQMIDQYNSLNKQLAAVAEQDQQLNQNINSILPAPAKL